MSPGLPDVCRTDGQPAGAGHDLATDSPQRGEPYGQTIYVTAGIGRCQREDGPIEETRPGDRVFFEPGENHWHGADPDRFMVHIAIQQVDEDGSAATFGDPVTDQQYNVTPAA